MAKGQPNTPEHNQNISKALKEWWAQNKNGRLRNEKGKLRIPATIQRGMQRIETNTRSFKLEKTATGFFAGALISPAGNAALGFVTAAGDKGLRMYDMDSKASRIRTKAVTKQYALGAIAGGALRGAYVGRLGGTAGMVAGAVTGGVLASTAAVAGRLAGYQVGRRIARKMRQRAVEQKNFGSVLNPIK